MILQSHLLSMVLYALLVSIVLALIRRDKKRAQVKYGVTLFLIMVVGAIAFGWFMYLFAR
jgi:glucan phosphoethanolaminetransferase (alkaline phosphatase superfamily)